MEMLSRRPAALFCLAFVYAGFVGTLLPTAVRIGIIALCALIMLLLPRLSSVRLTAPSRRAGCILLCGLLCGTAFFSLYAALAFGRTEQRMDGTSAPIVGVVQRREYATAYMAGYTVRLREAGGKRARYLILLDTADTSLSAGDIISCNADFAAFAEYSGAFPQRRYYYSRGVRIGAEAETVQITDRTGTGIRGLFEELRGAVNARLRVSLGRDAAALPTALLTGDREDLPDALTRDFRRLGIAHLLAISGFHFTVLIGAVDRLLRSVLASAKLRTVIAAALTVFYMLLCGMSESIVRAGLMLLLSFTAVLFRRTADMLTSLGVSAMLICAVNPASFYSVGLQLSVTAVLALAVSDHLKKQMPPRKTHFRFVRTLSESFFTTIAVQLMTLPLLCLYFGEISLLTPLTTVLFTPIVQLILLLTPILILLPTLTPLIYLLRLLSDTASALAGILSSIRGITVPLTYALCPYLACTLCGAVMLAVFTRDRRRMRRTAALFAAVFLCFCGYIGAAMLRNAANDRVISTVHKSNDALVFVSGGKYLLCDISDGSYGAISSAYEEARRAHAVELEALMLTHLHQRHIRAFDRLSDTTYVRALILPEPQNESEHSILHSLTDIASEKGIPVSFCDPSQNAEIAFGTFTILPGTRAYLPRSTHPVITLRVETAEGSLAYCGASWNEASPVPAPADAVILGAHGPIYKTQFPLPDGTVVARGNAADFLTAPPAGLTESEKTVILRFSP